MNTSITTRKLANFVIGGTEKAGTTSIFTYLSEHPQVCGSKVKETDFFRNHATGDLEVDASRYAEYFDRCGADARLYMEASPGYLGGGERVAARMHALIPEARLLFVLRDPVDRLYSSFNFHVGKLNLPADMSFETYIDKCIAYAGGQSDAASLGIGDWYLKAIIHGRYADYLEPFFRLYGQSRIKIMFFEDLNRDVAGFMAELSEFLEISPEFFAGYDFRKINATFSGKVKWLHQLAVYVNGKTEPFLRQRPRLKRDIVDTYKKFFQAREGYDPMSDAARTKLRAYYRPSIEALQGYVASGTTPWGT